MSFREDVFSKILTYITVAVLLGAMLAEAFVIYRERIAREETQGRLEAAQEGIRELAETRRGLEEEIAVLQEYKELWENKVILADGEQLALLRKNLHARTSLIPEEAEAAAVLAVEERLREKEEEAGKKEPEEEPEEIRVHLTFPDPENREWLLVLNDQEGADGFWLLYAKAEDAQQEVAVEFLYEVPLRRSDGGPERDEMDRIVWNCIAYNAGTGWQACVPEGDEERQ